MRSGSVAGREGVDTLRWMRRDWPASGLKAGEEFGIRFAQSEDLFEFAQAFGHVALFLRELGRRCNERESPIACPILLPVSSPSMRLASAIG